MTSSSRVRFNGRPRKSTTEMCRAIREKGRETCLKLIRIFIILAVFMGLLMSDLSEVGY